MTGVMTRRRVKIQSVTADAVALEVAMQLVEAEMIVSRAAASYPSAFLSDHGKDAPDPRHFSQPDLSLIYQVATARPSRFFPMSLAAAVMERLGYWDATAPASCRGSLWSRKSLAAFACDVPDEVPIVAMACGAVRRLRRQLVEGDRRIREAAEVYAGGALHTALPPGERAIRLMQAARMTGMDVGMMAERERELNHCGDGE